MKAMLSYHMYIVSSTCLLQILLQTIQAAFFFLSPLQQNRTETHSALLAFCPPPTVGRSVPFVGCASFFPTSDSLCPIEAAPCVLQDGWCGLKETCVSTSALCGVFSLTVYKRTPPILRLQSQHYIYIKTAFD